MKKALAILLVLTLLVSALTGCGGSKDSTVDPSNDPTESTQASRQTAQTARHEAAESFAGGSGTEDDPFQISEPGHLVLLHEMLKKEEEEINFDKTYVEGHYVLTADISLNDTSDFANWSTAAPQYSWVPIGFNLVSNTFAGVLDGNGHKITGMFIDADSGETDDYTDQYGLFSELRGTVKNLTVEQSYIRVSNPAGGMSGVGTIAGDTYEAVIDNCSADTVIEIYGTFSAGGIVGNATDTGNCTFSGTITQLDDGVSHIGGIAGSNGNIQGHTDSITDCTFAGTLSGKGHTGGIVGYGDNVKNSVNKGTVSGDTVGGIIGRIYSAGTDLEIEFPQLTVENCTNEGQVTGKTLAGGIVGWMGNDESDISMSVINCENKGQVICDEAIAGIIGKLSAERSGLIKVENCTNHVDISGKGHTGGIICDMTGAVLHQEGNVVVSGCKNLGNIVSEDLYSAGIVTYLTVIGDSVDFALTVENCSNEGAIQSTNCAGGILGFSNVGFNAEVSAENMSFSDDTKVVLSRCSNAGDVTVTTENSMAGGIVGVLGLGYIPTEMIGCTNTGAVSINFALTDEQIAEAQGAEWPEIYQMVGGIIGRIGDALKLSTEEGVETNADNVNTADGNIVISDCHNTGVVSAPDYSFILNKWGKPLYVNYLGGIVGQCGATDGYAFSVEGCTYSGAERGLGDTDYPDFGTKN